MQVLDKPYNSLLFIVMLYRVFGYAVAELLFKKNSLPQHRWFESSLITPVGFDIRSCLCPFQQISLSPYISSNLSKNLSFPVEVEEHVHECNMHGLVLPVCLRYILNKGLSA